MARSRATLPDMSNHTLTKDNDADAGTMLPEFVPFPAEDSEEHRRWQSSFRDGKVLLGPGDAVIDFHRSPHTLVVAPTGAGKTNLLTLLVYGALANPDTVELVLVDPGAAFRWADGHENVHRYAPTDAAASAEDVKTAATYAQTVVDERITLLREHGAESLADLRRGVDEGAITGIAADDVPRRLVVVVDCADAVYTPQPDPTVREVQDAARASMHVVGMLGRAVEVNIVMAAQQPSPQNLGSAVMSQLGTRIALGRLPSAVSTRVLGNTAATDMPEGTPKGRGRLHDDTGQRQQFQTYFLPPRDVPDCG